MADKIKPETGDQTDMETDPSVEAHFDAPDVLEGEIIDPNKTDLVDETEMLVADMVEPDAITDEIEPEVLGGEMVDPTEAEEGSTSEAEPVHVAEPAKKEPKRSGGFGGALIGGLIAAGLGFLLGQQGLLDGLMGRTDPANAIAANAIAAQANADQIAALAATVEAIPQPDLTSFEGRLVKLETSTGSLPDAVAAIEGRIVDLSALSDQISALEDQLSDLTGRTVELEARPLAGNLPEEVIAQLTSRITDQTAQTDATLEAARGAFDDQVAALTKELSARRAEAEAMLAEAQAAQAEAEAQAAKASDAAALQADFTALQTALESGLPFADVLAKIAATGVDVPAALSDVAADGVAPLAVLIDTYPEAARAALYKARDGGQSSLTGFLQKQLGIRSVTPRDGDDPDAILSRAEAATSEGRIGDAMTELSALPEDAQAPMASWMQSAAARDAALAAIADLANSLTVN